MRLTRPGPRAWTLLTGMTLAARGYGRCAMPIRRATADDAPALVPPVRRPGISAARRADRRPAARVGGAAAGVARRRGGRRPGRVRRGLHHPAPGAARSVRPGDRP